MRFGSSASLANAQKVAKGRQFGGRFTRLVESAVQGDFGETKAYSISGTPRSGRIHPLKGDEVPEQFQVAGRAIFRLTLEPGAAERSDRWQTSAAVYEVVDFVSNPDTEGAIALQILVAEVPNAALVAEEEP